MTDADLWSDVRGEAATPAPLRGTWLSLAHAFPAAKEALRRNQDAADRLDVLIARSRRCKLSPITD